MVAMAKVAEQAGRYDDMVEFMKERLESSAPMGVEERDLFSSAFKASLSERRQAIRMIADKQRIFREQGGPEDEVARAEDYKSKVIAEMSAICEQCIDTIKNNLLPAVDAGEAKVFYLKMQADYYRYAAEFADSDKKAEIAEFARESYVEAGKEAECHLLTTHPVRLALALNMSVFQHEVLRDTTAAVGTAKFALTTCQADLGQLPKESFEDVVETMHSLKDNLVLWEDELRVPT